MPTPPRVSCLMVTRPVEQRLAWLKLSVADYLRQNHAARELVIVIDPREAEPTTDRIGAFIASLGRDDIRIVEPGAARTLGALRNVSLAAARGDFFCNWDDDDRHHPDRLGAEAEALARGDHAGVCLQHVTHYFETDGQLYACNWINTETAGLPPTLMWRDLRTGYPETGPEADLGEDMLIIRTLKANGGLGSVADAPHLYVYAYHGWNNCTEEHHRWLVRELGTSRGLLQRNEAKLRAGLAAFDFGRPVTMMGSNGPAFVIEAA